MRDASTLIWMDIIGSVIILELELKIVVAGDDKLA